MTALRKSLSRLCPSPDSGSRSTSGRLHGKKFLTLHSSLFTFLLLLAACARMGAPDGGWYDETPPRVVSAMPADGAVDIKPKKVVINFSEYIKLENAQEKVVISPPQIEQPEIKAQGKRIVVELKDTLRDNTTYTIDFSDAISDNNEGNPLGSYTYTFSTGPHIDTMQVSGYVLSAEDLEPQKGLLVGLYSDLSDTIIRHQPMLRVSRTDSRGHFVIKGVAPGQYRAYALGDADGDYLFGQKSEMIAFDHDTISPTAFQDIRQDTLWADSLHIKAIDRVGFTHFMPDEVTLLAFQEEQTDRNLLKLERKDPDRFTIYFSYGSDTLPTLKALNFPDSLLLLEASERGDTLTYWLTDTTLVNQDTLRFDLTYQATDTLGQLQWQTDSAQEALAKTPYEKRLKLKQKEVEEWQKAQEKRKKRGQPYDSIYPPEQLKPKWIAAATMSPLQRVYMETEVPLTRLDTAAFHLYYKEDTLWYEAPLRLLPVKGKMRTLEVSAAWRPATEYSLEVDSAAMTDLFGRVNPPQKKGIKVGGPDDYSTLTVTLRHADTCCVVQLLNASGKTVAETRVDQQLRATFYYLKPDKYYLKAFADSNGNGRWDTGLYDEDRQAEAVYYLPELVECKAKWDVKRDWDLTRLPRFRQKPEKLVKQKAEKGKKRQQRNLQRAREKGIQYIEENTGVRL